ncbi:MAG TPA: hypothetical protein VMZ91_03755 [Candidatus Paceibacterota bacterium]|nr:hypothetical protein [Candidatus Paceibacterota bacterium]
MIKKKKMDYCRYCMKVIPFTVGVYRGYCGYNCYIKNKKRTKKITDF